MLADSLSYPSRPACPPWWRQPPPPGWTGTRGSGPSAPGLWSPPSPGCPRGLDGDTMSWIVLVTAFWRSGGVVQIKITDWTIPKWTPLPRLSFFTYFFYLKKWPLTILTFTFAPAPSLYVNHEKQLRLKQLQKNIWIEQLSYICLSNMDFLAVLRRQNYLISALALLFSPSGSQK